MRLRVREGIHAMVINNICNREAAAEPRGEHWIDFGARTASMDHPDQHERASLATAGLKPGPVFFAAAPSLRVFAGDSINIACRQSRKAVLR